MIKGIYKKGHIMQSINYMQSCESISKILFEADKKDPNNPKIKQMMGDLVEIASYVAYLERTLANKEIDNQDLLKKFSNLQEENNQLWKVKNGNT